MKKNKQNKTKILNEKEISSDKTPITFLFAARREKLYEKIE